MAGPGGGRTYRVGLGTIGVVAAAIVAAVFFRGGGGGSGGTGTGSGSNSAVQSQPVTPAQPQRPLRVTIQESQYVVDGKAMDLAALLDLADKVPAGGGPAVTVQRSQSSRARAEQDLKDALTKKSVSFTSD